MLFRSVSQSRYRAGDNSTKAVNSKYVDSAITSIQTTIGASGNLVYKGTYDASTSLPSLALAKKGFFYQVSASGTLAGVSLTTNDQIVFTSDVSGGVVQATDFIVIDNTESGLSNGGLVVATASNGARMSAGVYYLHDSSSNISLTVPPQGSAVGLVCYLRIRGTGSVTLNAEGVSGGTFIVYADSGTLNGVKSVVLSKAGEYKLVCTRRTTSGIVYSQWDVTVSNDRALRSTSDLVEGTNLYYTDARARAAFTAGTGITISTGTIATTITQYTDELAQDASASLFTTGTHTGISYSYNDASNKIDSTVSLSGFSIDALSDVDTSTTAPTNGQALAWSSSGSKWIPTTISGGGGSRASYTDVSAFPYTIVAPVSSVAKLKYYVSQGASAVTINLPAVASCDGLEIVIKSLGTGTITIDANGSETIDGALTFALSLQNSSVSMTCTSTGWRIE